ncbi:DUF1648 domain-containing protein [Natronincola ferrireducens]|uniref:Uncharacterized membrane protein n=1 Tax=Natronincola ferrireducens TaxID=393762 RepID=A0A1G8YWQ4_9FIRM|nr:DUF1648 domain-containing protein [Natronincola ferrireducens]SDK06485.1 Uncharacterized membrane protein [Natronincola ferrireducens]
MFLFVFLLNLFTVYIPLLLIGYFMPDFIKSTLLFGVVIPEEVSRTEEVVGLRKRYKRNYGLSGLITTLFLNVAAIYFQNTHILYMGIFLLIVIMTITYVDVHKRAKALKKEKGWMMNKKQVVVVDTCQSYNKKFISPHWFWCSVGIVIFTMLFTMIQYPHLPNQIPTQFDFKGAVMGYTDKNFFSVFGLPLTQVGMTTMFYIIYRIIKKVKPSINPSRPKTSSLQNQIAKRYWAIYMLVTITILNLQFLYIQLNVLQVINSSEGISILIYLLAIGIPILGAVGIAIKAGQSGSKIKIDCTEEADSRVIDRDDDGFWKWGMIYYNSQDPSLFIEKRFGIGWTINCGHPGGMVIMIATVFILLGSLVIPWIFK